MGIDHEKVKKNEMTVLRLFDTGDFVKRNETKFSWSVSKASIMENCLRKYYNDYYGSKKNTAPNEARKVDLKFLSKLSNRHTVLGTTVHDVIKIFFEKARNGEKWELSKLQWLAEKKINDSIEYSIEIRDGEESEREYFPPALKEVYYSTEEIGTLRASILSKAKVCLSNFFTSPEFNHLKIEGQKPGAFIETDCRFRVSESVLVSGKIDIAFFQQDGTFLVSDWKTGYNDEGPDSLQLSIYALWAAIEKQISVKNIVIQKAFLLDGTIEKLNLSEIQLERARMRVIQSAQSIRLLDPYGNKGNKAAFTPTRQIKVCELCPYEKRCQKEIN
jgi:hypothetical protein